MSRKGKIILISIFASVGFLFFSPTLFGAKVFLPFWLVSQVRSFLAENQLHACDYKDGEIILVKPVATGVGEGRYEAGDIVEIRDGSTMCERFGNGNFLGAEERTMLLPVYYPGKLTEEQKKELLEPEYEDIQCPRNLDIECPSQDIASPKVEQKILHRRQVGVDYTQFLSDREIIKVRQFEKLDRLPEIDLSPIINKKSGLSLKEDLSAVALAKAETKNTAISSDILADFNEVRSPRLGINFSIASQYNLSSFPVDSGLSEPVGGFAPPKSRIPSLGSHSVTGSTSSYQTAENKSNQSKDLRCPNIDGQCGDIASQNIDSVVYLPPRLQLLENTINTVKTIVQKIIPPVFAQTESVKVVDPGNGAGTDYTSLNAWEAAQQADLTAGGGVIAVAKCRATNGTADTTNLAILGWTTSATQYIKIWTDPSESYRHNGKWNTGKYRLESSGDMFNIYANHVRIDGLQIQNTDTTIDYTGTFIYTQTGSSEIWISNCIYKGVISGTATPRGLLVYETSATVKIWNNIFYDWINSTYDAEALRLAGTLTGTIYIYNNTFQNNYYGIYQNSGSATVIAKNNIVKGSGNTNAYVGTFASGTDYNATDGTDNIGQGTHNRTSQTFIFADATNKDFHLSPTDTGARNYGTDLSADSNLAFSNDIDGNPRPMGGAWDIGADEYGHKTQINTPLSGRFKDSSLVGYWSFDGQNTNWSSATAGTTNDLSGQGNTGTMTNMSRSTSPVPGISGQALSFDGVDDKVVVIDSNSLDLTSAGTIEAWVYIRSIDPVGLYAMIYEKFAGGAQSSNGYQFCFEQSSSGHLYTGVLLLGNGAATNFYSADNMFALNTWLHLGVTWDGTNIKFYKNGVQHGSNVSQTRNAVANTLPLNIGLDTGWRGYLNGFLDEERVYNRALTASEITDLYKIGAARLKVNTPVGSGAQGLASGLVGYWTFNGQNTTWSSATAGTTNDLSGQGNTGTMTNMNRSTSPSPGISGQALSFDGVDDYVNISLLPDFVSTGSYTYSAWVKITQNKANKIIAQERVYTIPVSAGNGFSFGINSSNVLEFYKYASGAETAVASTTSNTITLNQWTFVTATYSNGSITLYIDGLAKGNGSGTFTNFSFGLEAIGARSMNIANTPTDYFDGLIDEVRIYNRVLSADEILQLYNMGVRKVKFKQ